MILLKMKYYEEQRLDKAHHKFELNEERGQNEQEDQAEQGSDDLKYFESNKTEVNTNTVSA